MKKAMLILAAAAVLSGGSAVAAPELEGEAKLARELEGRVPGEPVTCINTRVNQSSQIIEGTAIVFGRGSTIYVNRPRAGADSLRHWDSMVTKQFGSQLCSIDTVQMVDLTSGMYRGSVFLGDFVPYTRVKS